MDPTSFNDGVLYLPAMVEFWPGRPDWGLPDTASWRRRVEEDRPHGGDEESGKLLCLKCMAINVRNGGRPSPVWMYLRERRGRRLFCHVGGDHFHPEHEPPSDERNALVEREARTCEQVGAAVSVGVRTAGGQQRVDFVATGPEVTLAGMIQRSVEPVGRIAQRQHALAADGKQALWTTDSVRPQFLDGVPRLVIPSLRNWQQALHDPELAVVAGLTLVEYQRCGWFDTWTGSIRCPATGRLRGCGALHPYPAAHVKPNTYRPGVGPVARLSRGDRPHLDFVVAGIVLGQWLPYERKAGRRRVCVWMPADDYHRFVQDRAASDLGSSSHETDPAPLAPTRRSETTLDWADHEVGDPEPCQHCGEPALCRDSSDVPTHKVCAEQRSQGGPVTRSGTIY